ncbi:MAG: hypothetical protein KDM63_14380, partial [Verrucomicrobiae bacterium]|nr:hypothetical protein [Verrucomicrobiae bacterium]
WLSISSSEDGKSVTFQPVGNVEPGPDSIQSLAWSPDGHWVAAGSFRRITLWNAASREKLAEITADLKGRLSALAFSPDSRTLLGADSVDAASGRLLIIDSAGAKVTRVIDAHRDTIFAIAVSPNGKIAATASADKSAKVWDLSKGEAIHTLEGHTGYVLAAAFSPTGDRLATGGDDEAVKIWLIETGKQIASFGGARTGPVTALAWTTDPEKEKAKAAEKDPEKAKEINADRIASVNEMGQPRIYNDLKDHEGAQTSTGAREKACDALSEELTAIAIDPATLRLFSGSTRGTIAGWDAAGKLALRSDMTTSLAQSKP